VDLPARPIAGFRAISAERLIYISPLGSGSAPLGTAVAAASNTYGRSLQHMRLQPQTHTGAAFSTYGCSLPSNTYGCSLKHLRLEPPTHTVAASHTYGCSLHTYGCSLQHMGLQPPARMVAAPSTYGCRPGVNTAPPPPRPGSNVIPPPPLPGGGNGGARGAGVPTPGGAMTPPRVRGALPLPPPPHARSPAPTPAPAPAPPAHFAPPPTRVPPPAARAPPAPTPPPSVPAPVPAPRPAANNNNSSSNNSGRSSNNNNYVAPASWQTTASPSAAAAPAPARAHNRYVAPASGRRQMAGTMCNYGPSSEPSAAPTPARSGAAPAYQGQVTKAPGGGGTATGALSRLAAPAFLALQPTSVRASLHLPTSIPRVPIGFRMSTSAQPRFNGNL